MHLSIVLFLVVPALAIFTDCKDSDSSPGPYGFYTFDATYEGKPLVIIVPTASPPSAEGYPLIVFMHGSTGEFEMYRPNLEHFTSHGFVAVFPYVKNAVDDKSPFTTNTNGDYIIRGIEYARNATADQSSPLYAKVDLNNVISAGHSMGATCSIMAGSRLAKSGGNLKLVVAQHPGICGPFGPPPYPSTWMKSDLKTVAAHFPLIFTTATNDGAFWPQPYTAEHELGCFNGANLNGTTSAFIQFNAASCDEDKDRSPYPDGGHNCPLKKYPNTPETPWVLVAMKLYTHMGGSSDSNCADLLWGNGATSLAADSNLDRLVRNHPGSISAEK